MLGRKVGERLPRTQLLAPEVKEIAGAADLFVANLECCISARGEPVRIPGKPFFFRAPPAAAEWLAEAGVNCATLANNHAVDFGDEALADTLDHLAAAGVAAAGAGANEAAARTREGSVAKLPYAGLNRIRFEGSVSTAVVLAVPPLREPLKHVATVRPTACLAVRG